MRLRVLPKVSYYEIAGWFAVTVTLTAFAVTMEIFPGDRRRA